ncbi:MAG: CCA tRNA nucleotidyltransferase [Chloroflexi bacterium]|nr:CCA tRNA nucleotidyltransferase [Chloroflexota bacterium]
MSTPSKSLTPDSAAPDFRTLGKIVRDMALRSDELRRLAQIFTMEGHQLYLVGGTIRDMLRGIPTEELLTKDIDLATDADPDRVALILRRTGWPVFEVGKRYGTVGTQVSPTTFEITTFRSDVYRTGNRHPEVTFSNSIEEDIARRDFTINSMAVSLIGGPLLDPTGGLEDLRHRIIRVTGLPAERFRDDPLRLMRAARFAAQLGFEIAPGTKQAIRRAAAQLKTISRERMRDELIKILISPNPGYGLQLLVNLHLMQTVAPPVDVLKDYQDETKQGFKNLLVHTLRVVQGTPSKLVVRLAALLHDVGKPQTFSNTNGQVHFFDHERVGANIARQLLASLRFDAVTIRETVYLVELHMRPAADTDTWTDSAIRRFVREVGEERLQDLFALARADITSQNPHRVAGHLSRLQRLIERCERTIAEMHTAHPESPLDGSLIMQLTGLTPGPIIGEIKAHLLNEVLDGRLAPDDRELATQLMWSFLTQRGIATPTKVTDAGD